jgi:hypothetical protein
MTGKYLRFIGGKLEGSSNTTCIDFLLKFKGILKFSEMLSKYQDLILFQMS